jgi:ABC-type multidrug transport system fused ATPase/permease subunit
MPLDHASTPTNFLRVLGRAWELIAREDRRRLRLLAVYGVAIAALDTFALILVFAVISLLDNQPAVSVSDTVMHWLGLIRHDRYETALLLFALTTVLFIVRSLLSVLGLWMTFDATNRAQVNLVALLLRGHARAPQLVRLERDASETLRTVVNSVSQVTYGVVGSSVYLISNLAVAGAVALGLFLSSPFVAGVIVVYFAFIALAWMRLVRGALERRGRHVQELQREQLQLVLQALSAAKELQLRGRSLFYSEEAVARTQGIATSSRGANVINASVRYLLETSLVLGAVLIVAAAGLTSGRASVLPAVGLILAGAFRLLPALNQVLFLNNQVQYNRSAIGLVERELATFGPYADLDGHAAVTEPLRFEHELRFEHVRFKYPTRTAPAVRDMSFSINPGESIGIVGPIGSGKSTLLDMILGLLDPDQGEITIDGAPLAKCREHWQRSIGYVPQDVYLVDESLRANIALGWRGEDIDDTAVDEAVRLARLEEILAILPEGLNTVVGERGVRLSGGQKQLVGLARALYVRPSVLVLDEATSNLDQSTETRIIETLAALHGRVTTIVVTHRPSSVERCDRILYLEAGSLQAEGALEDLRPRLALLRTAPADERIPFRAADAS